MSEVIRHVVASIGPASRAHAEAAHARFVTANLPLLARLAGMLGGAQHTPRPRVGRRMVVVVAGDHGAADPGISLGASHPTVLAASEIASGRAALANLVRTSLTPIVIVDAGVTEPAAMPAGTIRLGSGPTQNLLHGPAMTLAEATLGLEAGIALAISLTEPGLDVLVVGALGLGSELAAAAIAAPSLAGAPDVPMLELEPDMARAHARGRGFSGDGLGLLAAFGGPETCVLAGLMLGAASVHVPVILDGHATGAAAVVAARLARDVTGSLIAAHRGSPLHARLLSHLELAPIFEAGLGHGEGSGAALLLPWLDQVEAVLGPR